MAERNAVIAYATPYPVGDFWASGTNTQIARALQEHYPHLQIISPLPTAPSKWGRAMNLLHRCGLPVKRRLPAHRWANAKAMGKALEARLHEVNPDVVVVSSSLAAACLGGNWPVILYSDATLAGMIDYYDAFGDLSAGSKREGLAVERAALNRCSRVFMASAWARQWVLKSSDLAAEAVDVLPRGANQDPRWSAEQAEAAARARSLDEPNLLFVGLDWPRKGGPRVLQTLGLLRERGIKARLTIIGCQPAVPEALAEHVTALGELNVYQEWDRRQLEAAFEQATLLFVPSEAEAMGIVYCDACAYALPSVARDTGGVATVVHDGRTGRLLGGDADAEAYAEAIAGIVGDREAYVRMSLGAHRFYETQCNWRTVGRVLAEAVEAVATGKQG